MSPDTATASARDRGLARQGDGPRLYDFRRPDKLGRDQVRLLQIANETFARQFGMVLTSSLRAMASVSLLSIDQLTYDEYIRAVETPTFLAVISLDGIKGTGCLEIPVPASMRAVDHLLGGTGKGSQPKRGLSDIESVLMRAQAEKILAELDYAYESLAVLNSEVSAVEANPRFAQVAPSTAMMIVASFEVRIGNHESVATLCIPHSALGPVLEKAVAASAGSARDSAGDGAFASGMRERLSGVSVDVSVRFQAVRLATSDILGLEVGDVIRLPHPTASPLHVTSSGVVSAYAVPGKKGKRLACRIVPPAVNTTASTGQSPVSRTS